METDKTNNNNNKVRFTICRWSDPVVPESGLGRVWARQRGQHPGHHPLLRPALQWSVIIIIMEICKAPTRRLKAMNKHNKTHIAYIEMENVTCNFYKSNKGSSITMCKVYAHTQTRTHARTHAHTHTHCTDWKGWMTMLLKWNILRREMSQVCFWRKRE